MGFFSFLMGNRVEKNNNKRIAKVKRQLELMSKAQKVNKLRNIDKIVYPESRLREISSDDIHECNFELSLEFLTYYFLFMDNSIRSEARKVVKKQVLYRDFKGRFCKNRVYKESL